MLLENCRGITKAVRGKRKANADDVKERKIKCFLGGGSCVGGVGGSSAKGGDKGMAERKEKGEKTWGGEGERVKRNDLKTILGDNRRSQRQ